MPKLSKSFTEADEKLSVDLSCGKGYSGDKMLLKVYLHYNETIALEECFSVETCHCLMCKINVLFSLYYAVSSLRYVVSCLVMFFSWGYTFISFGFVLLPFGYILKRFGFALFSFHNVLLSFGFGDDDTLEADF